MFGRLFPISVAGGQFAKPFVASFSIFAVERRNQDSITGARFAVGIEHAFKQGFRCRIIANVVEGRDRSAERISHPTIPRIKSNGYILAMEHSLAKPLEDALLEATGARGYQVRELVQTLWSGYGQILRVGLEGAADNSVILKHVQPIDDLNHPRGWNTNRSHQRKVRSYDVELHWYRHWSHRCDSSCRIPRLIHSIKNENELGLILEDLDEAGFTLRRQNVSNAQLQSCLKWLAEFHATFLGESPDGLWQTGTYWHLETRPDELAAIKDENLKKAAKPIDAQLANARFQTLVHGDAKLANFCFSNSSDEVAAVDFQYVGGGCGMKDVAYFLGSCLRESELEQLLEPGDSLSDFSLPPLEDYFQFLSEALSRRRPDVDAVAVIDEWSELFPWAWTDFYRFLQGWSPGHWKINSFSERLSNVVIGRMS